MTLAAAYVQVKIEEVEDIINLEEDLSGGEMEALKQELAYARQTIAEQKAQLAEFQRRFDHQEDLLMRLEMDQETDKAVAQAEVKTLRKLLEVEKRRRILAERGIGERGDTVNGVLNEENKKDGRSAEEEEGLEVNENEDEEDDDVTVVSVVRRRRKEPDVPCTVCGLRFNAGRRLIEHVQQYHPLIEVEVGGNSSVNRKSMEQRSVPQETIQTDDEEIEEIPITPASTPGLPSTAREAIATSDNKFPCHLCGDSYAILSKLKKHWELAHGIIDDTFSIGCKDCGLIFSTRSDHHFHRRSVHGSMYSGKKRLKPDQIQQKSQASTSSSSPSVWTPPTEVATAIPSASTSSTSSSFEVQHGIHPKQVRNIHGGLIHYCLCGRSFRTERNLEQHIRLIDLEESSEKPPKRSKATPTTATPAPPFTKHGLVGPDPQVMNAKYPCSCGNIYFSRPGFMHHIRTKGNGKIFKCNLCPMTFESHGNLKNHVIKGHKVTYNLGKFACGKCAKTFGTRSGLIRHRFFLCKHPRSYNKK